MRKKSTRLLSAALAACMMLSVLPVGAFAAEPEEEPENGVSAQTSLPVIENSEIKSADTDQVIDKAGTYTMSGNYANRIIVNTDGDVTIKVTGNIKFTREVTYNGGEIALWHVAKVGTLTIDNSDGFEVSTVPGSYTEVLREDYGANATQINVNGGVYKGNKNCTFQFSSNGKVNMNNVTAEGDTNVIRTNGGGDVTITNGKYKGLEEYPVISGEKGILNIYGGEYVGKGVVLSADGSVQMNINGAKVSGKPAIGARETGKATITDCIIKDSKRGIWAKNDKVILNSATFENNESDIYLETGKTITIADTFTDTATVKCEDAALNRRITTDTDSHYQKDLKLVSMDPDYIIDYKKNEDGIEYRCLSARETGKYYVNPIQATMAVGDTEVRPYTQFMPGTKVTLNAFSAEEGKKLTRWKVEKIAAPESEVMPNAGMIEYDPENPETATLTVPNYDVFVTAEYEDEIVDPGTGDDAAGNIQGALSAVVIGAAAGAIIYEAGTGIYRVINMPGIPMPSNRIELAELLWERADKPEPVSTALYDDIDEDDTDAQKAARWAVEQDLMKDDADNNKFNPYFPVSKLRVCLTWNAAKEKGLFDTDKPAE